MALKRAILVFLGVYYQLYRIVVKYLKQYIPKYIAIGIPAVMIACHLFHILY